MLLINQVGSLGRANAFKKNQQQQRRQYGLRMPCLLAKFHTVAVRRLGLFQFRVKKVKCVCPSGLGLVLVLFAKSRSVFDARECESATAQVQGVA